VKESGSTDQADPAGDAPSLRRRAYGVLEETEPGSLQLLDVLLVLLIILNVLAVMLETVDAFAERHRTALLLFEIASVALFSVEYLARLWVCVERSGHAHPLKGRIRYALTPIALVDLLAIAPFFLGLLVNVDLRWLRMLRLLRVFKLTRYSAALNALLDVFREELGIILAATMILLVMLVLAAGGIYLFEHEAQPQAFASMPGALWWAVTTLTTVGYGDVTPVTLGGRIFGGLVMLIGIVMVALPAGILASALSEHIRARRESYEVLVDRVLASGSISADDRHRLLRMREELGLSREQARRILARVARAPGALRSVAVCPHCGESLLEHHAEERHAQPGSEQGGVTPRP
jgi:voltage-gated potassium channel